MKTKLRAIGLVLGVIATPAMAKTRHISGPGDPQWAALARAQPGDVVLLGPGVYPALVVPAGADKGAAGVTVKAAPGAQVVLAGASFAAGGWRLVNDQLPGAGVIKVAGTVQISKANGVSLEGLEIVGDPGAADLTAMTGAGVVYRDVANLSIVRCRIHHWENAIAGLHAKGLTVSDNVFSYTSSDLVHIGGDVSHARFTRNLFTQVHAKTTVHQDGLQIFANFATGPLDDISITDNQFIRGAGGSAVQGIFLQGGAATPITNLRITGNLVMEGNYWAIGVADCADFTISNNYYGGYTDARDGGRAMEPWLRLTRCSNGAIVDNTGTSRPLLDASDRGIKVAGQKLIGLARPDDLRAAKAWWAARQPNGPSPSPSLASQ